MNGSTCSEQLFERLCVERGIGCVRIPTSAETTADYRVSLDSLTLITEVKQLDENAEDKKLKGVWGTPQSPGAIAPSKRVQGLLNDGYTQVKRLSLSEGKLPTMIVVYNNSGPWNYINGFTMSKAMLGEFGVELKGILGTLHFGKWRFFGERKLTKSTFRYLSVTGVLKLVEAGAIRLDCHHNPYAINPIEPSLLKRLAYKQYKYHDPHGRGSRNPETIEI